MARTAPLRRELLRASSLPAPIRPGSADEQRWRPGEGRRSACRWAMGQFWKDGCHLRRGRERERNRPRRRWHLTLPDTKSRLHVRNNVSRKPPKKATGGGPSPGRAQGEAPTFEHAGHLDAVARLLQVVARERVQGVVLRQRLGARPLVRRVALVALNGGGCGGGMKWCG